jgi:hypothetical protein
MPFRGQLDDIRIWGDLRTQEEIYDNRHVVLGGNEDDLAGYWPISTGSGAIIKDASGHGNHARLNISTQGGFSTFWRRSSDRKDNFAAPIGSELPQVRYLLDGPRTAWTVGEAFSCGAAEYGDVQTSADGLLQAMMKRCQVYLNKDGNCVTWTGYKVGDLDLTYIGQAQSDPTLIGYIEGAPPVPSENATRPHYESATDYDAYDDSASVQLVESANTVQLYTAESFRGFDQDFEIKIVTVIYFVSESGVAFGGYFSIRITNIAVKLAALANFSNSYNYLTSGEAEIEATRTLTSKLGLAGDWEKPDAILNDEVGRRYEFDNKGYALVKSGVANVYSMKMRKTGALMGITMIPDPDIKEDYNIIMFPIQPTYTKQGTLDGMVGFEKDPHWQAVEAGKGSYFKPKEVNNLVKQIEAYEAKIAANYADFNAGRLGRRQQGAHFQEDDPAQNAQHLIEKNIEMPYDWDRQISKRNIVNTYVWTADGGYFAEQQETAVSRTESSGGSYSFKGQAGLAAEGSFKIGGFGIAFEASVLLGGHIETTVVKALKEGRNFGVDVELNTDGLLRRYTGDPDNPYDKADAPGKVTGYRFKTFYLVPDKKHFRTFWERVVDQDWLNNSDHPNARALRAAQGNLNHVWRVLHRVTFVSRVPPSGKRAESDEKPTRAVIHQVPNWGIINLVLDVLRKGETSKGKDISALGSQPFAGTEITREQLGEAVADVVDNQWGYSVPWWSGYKEHALANTGLRSFGEYRDIKQAVHDYMLAYFETGEAVDQDRLKPERAPAGRPQRADEDKGKIPCDDKKKKIEDPIELPEGATMEALAANASHLYTFSAAARATDLIGADTIDIHDGAELDPASDIDGCQGKLLLPFGKPDARGEIGLTYDWGRDADRTWEIVFRLNSPGLGLLLSYDPDLAVAQRFIEALGFGLPDRGDFFIHRAGEDEPERLTGLSDSDTGQTIYIALSYDAAASKLTIIRRKQSDAQRQATFLDVPEGLIASGFLILGGAGREHLRAGRTREAEIEIHHFAVYDHILSDKALKQRFKLLQLTG